MTFADITEETGIRFRHAASKTSLKYLLETMGRGVATFDYDNDCLMDLFFTNGAALKDPILRRELKISPVMAGAGYDESGRTFAGMGFD